MRESAASGGSRGEKRGCSWGVKNIHNAETRKSKPAPVSITARAQSSTPPCAATANATSAQMPMRSVFMVWNAPRVPEPKLRHPPRRFPGFCFRVDRWENEPSRLVVPGHLLLRTRVFRYGSQVHSREHQA